MSSSAKTSSINKTSESGLKNGKPERTELELLNSEERQKIAEDLGISPAPSVFHLQKSQTRGVSEVYSREADDKMD